MCPGHNHRTRLANVTETHFNQTIVVVPEGEAGKGSTTLRSATPEREDQDSAERNQRGVRQERRGYGKEGGIRRRSGRGLATRSGRLGRDPEIRR